MSTRTLVVVVCCVTGVTACSGAPAPAPVPEQAKESLHALAASTTASAPANPSDYLPTPNGLIHRSCIFELPLGATLDTSANVLVNGNVVDHHDPCPYPALVGQSQQPKSPDAGPAHPPGSTWVEDAFQAFNGDPNYGQFNLIEGDYNVPSNPPSNGGLFYFFMGSQGTDGLLLQPVLQWGNNNIYNSGNWWSLVAWWFLNGNSYHWGNTVNPNSGDHIHSEQWIENTGPGEWEWYVEAADVTKNQVSAIQVWSTGLQNEALGGVLEVYPLSSCNQLPYGGGGGDLQFYNVGFFGPSGSVYNYQQLPLNMGTFVVSSFSPWCGYSVGTASWGDDLWF